MGKVHFIYLWFGPFTSFLSVVYKLTLYPPVVLPIYIRYKDVKFFLQNYNKTHKKKKKEKKK